MRNLRQIIGDGRGDKDYKVWFHKIAEELIFRCHISTGKIKFRIKEIEFYYHCDDHEDLTVYGIIGPEHKLNSRIYRHKKRQYEQFTWFVHYSGIDIVFGDADKPGGILIRSIERIGENGSSDELIEGPLIVLLELMNQSTSVFNSTPFELCLKEAEEEITGNITEEVRVGIKDSRKYNFSLKTSKA